MPRQSEWIHKVPEILERMGQASEILCDRVAIERMFQVSPRQATRILSRLGAGRVGGAMILAGDVLRDRLQQLQQDETVVFEQHRQAAFWRKMKVAEQEARLRRIKIPGVTEVPLEDLPSEIHLRPGELHIRFSRPVDLLEKLMTLAQAISQDWDAFVKQNQRN